MAKKGRPKVAISPKTQLAKRLCEVVGDENISTLASNIGVTYAAVRPWLTGDAVPSLENLQKVADHLRVSAGWLATGHGNRITGEPDEEGGQWGKLPDTPEEAADKQDFRTEFGQRLKALRIAKFGGDHGSLAAAARAMGLQIQRLCDAESGRAEPMAAKVLRFAEFYGVSPGFLLFGHTADTTEAEHIDLVTSALSFAQQEALKMLREMAGEVNQKIEKVISDQSWAEDFLRGYLDEARTLHKPVLPNVSPLATKPCNDESGPA